MAQIQRGYTFIDGGTGNAAELHELVDDATILPGIITQQASAPPANPDSFLFYQARSQTLASCTLSQLIAAFPVNQAANVACLRQLGTGATVAAAGNDPRFPAQITGIRKGHGTGADTAATAPDLDFSSVDLANLTAIDWSAGNFFHDSLTANKTYTFSNVTDGRAICAVIVTNGHTPTFPTTLGSIQTLGSGTTGKIYYCNHTALGTVCFCVAF